MTSPVGSERTWRALPKGPSIVVSTAGYLRLPFLAVRTFSGCLGGRRHAGLRSDENVAKRERCIGSRGLARRSPQGDPASAIHQRLKPSGTHGFAKEIGEHLR